MISGDVIWPAQFAANGWMLDLSDQFSESQRQKFLSAPVESNIYEGAIYGVPWFTDVGMLYYRKDLLQQSGISEPLATREELKQIAEQFNNSLKGDVSAEEAVKTLQEQLQQIVEQAQ